MNLNKLRSNIGRLFKLEPREIRLDEQGRELPRRDEEWLLQEISPDDDFLTLRDRRILGLSTPIGADAVHHFDTEIDGLANHLRVSVIKAESWRYELEFWILCPYTGCDL
jgi:hypothetical protein